MRDIVSTHLDGWERALERWRARAKQTAASWAFRAFPRLAPSALAVAAAGFEPGPIPHFFSTDILQIDPSLNDDLLELYGRADQVVANRLAFFNSTQAFAQGIDWDPPQSPSWRAELHAFDYALDLACTYRISGEEVYARQLRYVIAHWIASNPPAVGAGWEPDILSRRARNWMLAADLARSDWERDTEFKSLVATSLAQQVAFLLGQLDVLATANTRLCASRALLCASRFFAGTGAQHALDWGSSLLSTMRAGPPPEPWPNSRLAKAQALMEWNLLAPPGADSSSLARDLAEALDELEMVLTPDGSLPLLGPQARLAPDELADLAALAAVKLESPAWKSLAGKFGILPYLLLGETGKMRFEGIEKREWTPQKVVTPGAQILRLVGPRKSALSISARLPSSPEEHQDFTSYELTLNGYRVVVDSGGFTREESDYFPRARAHNLLLIDGAEPRWQSTAGCGAARVEFEELSPSCARLRMCDPGFGFLGIQHERAWFRLESDAWLILDWIGGTQVHSLVSLIHFYPTFEVEAGTDCAVARSRSCSLGVIPVSSAKPRLTVSRGSRAQFPGWFSPELGVKFSTSVLALNWVGVDLPWLGGALITTGVQAPLRQIEIDPAEGHAQLDIAGKIYDLRMR